MWIRYILWGKIAIGIIVFCFHVKTYCVPSTWWWASRSCRGRGLRDWNKKNKTYSGASAHGVYVFNLPTSCKTAPLKPLSGHHALRRTDNSYVYSSICTYTHVHVIHANTHHICQHVHTDIPKAVLNNNVSESLQIVPIHLLCIYHVS